MTLKHYTCILLFALVLISCNTGPKLFELQFLEGTWQMEGKDAYEKWELKNDQIQGYGYKLKDGKEIISETLVIRVEGDHVLYEATVPDQNEGGTVAFTLNSEEKEKFSFENADHDFPKKIQYQPLNDSTLFVNVRGANDDGFSFRLLKR